MLVFFAFVFTPCRTDFNYRILAVAAVTELQSRRKYFIADPRCADLESLTKIKSGLKEVYMGLNLLLFL